MGGGAQQNRVTPSPFDFRLWTFGLDLDCDNSDSFKVSLSHQRFCVGKL